MRNEEWHPSSSLVSYQLKTFYLIVSGIPGFLNGTRFWNNSMEPFFKMTPNDNTNFQTDTSEIWRYSLLCWDSSSTEAWYNWSFVNPKRRPSSESCLVVSLAKILNHFFQTLGSRSFHPRIIRMSGLMWNELHAAWNRLWWELLIFWPEGNYQLSKKVDSPYCSIIKVSWTYHTFSGTTHLVVILCPIVQGGNLSCASRAPKKR